MARRKTDRAAKVTIVTAQGCTPAAIAFVVLTLGAFPAFSQGGPEEIAGSLPDAVRRQVASCWSMPSDADGKVRIEARFRADGSLDGKPRVVLRPAGVAGDQLAASAVRALMRCEPFRLPPERYEDWKVMVLDFEPSNLE